MDDIDPDADEYDDEDSSVEESELNDEFDVDADYKKIKQSSDDSRSNENVKTGEEKKKSKGSTPRDGNKEIKIQ